MDVYSVVDGWIALGATVERELPYLVLSVCEREGESCLYLQPYEFSIRWNIAV